MNFLGIGKKITIFILIALIFTLAATLFILSNTKRLPPAPPPVLTAPSPSSKPNIPFTPHPTIMPEGASNGVGPNTDPALVQKYRQDQANQDVYLAKRQRISQLLLKLPYKGTNFTLTYNIKNNLFTLELNKDNPDQGQQEFNQFLAEQNIDKQYMEIDTIYK